MDDLAQELNELRINWDETAREYHRTVQVFSTRERLLLVEINYQRQREDQFQNNIRDSQANPIKGDIVRITNNYKAEDTNRVYRVTNVTRRMVKLRCTKTNKYCKRAWWNVKRVSDTQTQ